MMDRDFMGLAVKQETPEEESKHPAPLGGSPMQWSIPNKVSGPHFVSFNGTHQEDKPKTGYESLVSTGLVTITTSDPCDSIQKTHPGVMQKNMALAKQGGIPYTVTTYPAQHLDVHSVHRPESYMSFLSPAGRNLTCPSSAQYLGEVSKRGTVPAIPAGTYVVGTTDLWNGSKRVVTSAQLTIFYNGSVCVYDDISQEKAQAIMLLAGNGPHSASNTTPTTAPIQAPSPRSSVIDGLVINHSHGRIPCNPSRIAFSSHNGSLTAGTSGSCSHKTSLKSSGGLTSPSTTESSKVVNILGSSPGLSNSSAVPQARKASLTRFLERRKGRIISASPYAKGQSTDACTKLHPVARA